MISTVIVGFSSGLFAGMGADQMGAGQFLSAIATVVGAVAGCAVWDVLIWRGK